MAPRAVPLPSGPSICAHSAQVNSYNSGPTKKRRGGCDIEKSFDNQPRSELDCAIGRMFYTSGLPFSLARNPNYFSCFTLVANRKLGGYVPPGYNRIRTTLLENEKKHVDLSLTPIKSTWGAKGVTINICAARDRNNNEETYFECYWITEIHSDVVRIKNYIVNHAPIYDMIRVCDTDKPCLNLVYEMWDVMIEKVKKVIYEHKHIENEDYEFTSSSFYDVVHKILVARWAKSSTPLHCLAHSLHPRYYSQEWLAEDSARKPPHVDDEVSMERRKSSNAFSLFRRLL
ncbi:hypothetical protein QQ045_022370 [Rhodiola kirilowii]